MRWIGGTAPKATGILVVVAAVALSACGLLPVTQPSWVPSSVAPRWAAMPVDGDGVASGRQVFDVSGSPRAVRQVELAVSNSSDADLAVRVSPSAVASVDGELVFSEPQKVSDPASWLRVPDAADRIVVPPGASRLVPVTVTYPNTARPGEQLAGVTATDLATGTEVNVPVRLRTDGPLRSDLTLGETAIDYVRPGRFGFGPGEAQLDFRVENTGNTILAGRFVLQLDTVFDHKVVLLERDDVVLTPGAVLEGRASAAVWPSLVLRPEALVEVTASEVGRAPSTFAVGDMGSAVTVIPWSELVAVALAAGGAFAMWMAARVISRSRSSRSARREPARRAAT